MKTSSSVPGELRKMACHERVNCSHCIERLDKTIRRFRPKTNTRGLHGEKAPRGHLM